MSAPHCPSTVVVARHAAAGYERPDPRGVDEGRLTAVGRTQAEQLAESLRFRRVAAVYTSPLQRARETGAILGDRLGVRCTLLSGVEEFRVGEYAGRGDGGVLVGAVFDRWLAGHRDASCPGGETAHQVTARFRAALQGVADEHRGETIVVVSHGGAMSLAIPGLCARPDLARAHWLPNCAVAELSIGADGWDLLQWPGSEQSTGAEPPA